MSLTINIVITVVPQSYYCEKSLSCVCHSMRKTVRKLGEGVFGEVFHVFTEERDNLALKVQLANLINTALYTHNNLLMKCVY